MKKIRKDLAPQVEGLFIYDDAKSPNPYSVIIRALIYLQSSHSFHKRFWEF
jgi:hypothetical protein